MSDSPALPQSLSFSDRDAILNMILIESLGFGIYTAIFWFTMYMLVFHKRGDRTRGSSTYLIIVPLYILAMIHLSVHWTVVRSAFVIHGDTADSVVQAFLGQPEWCIGVSAISFFLMTLIVDYVTVWRCWTVWDRNWKAAIVPFLLVFTGTAFCIIAVVYQIDPNSGLATSNFNKYAKFGMIYFVFSVCSTAICTLLIVYRILSVSKESGFSQIGPYRKILEIIVESAALYTVALIVYLPLLVRNDFKDGYPKALLVSITGIAPTIITARVSLGITRNYSTVKSPEFIDASAVTITQSTSKTMYNEDLSEPKSEFINAGREGKADSVV